MNTATYGRYGTALTIAGLATGTLLLVMQHLIATSNIELNKTRAFRLTPWVRVEEPTEIKVKERTPLPPPVAEKPRTDLPESVDPSGPGARITVTLPGPLQPGPIGGRAGFSDGDYIPITKVLPIYPERAKQRGLEGYVVLEFTVTRIGTVENIQVVESTHSVFDSAAIRAASRFRYKPRVIDGTAVEVRGVRNKISFQLEK